MQSRIEGSNPTEAGELRPDEGQFGQGSDRPVAPAVPSDREARGVVVDLTPDSSEVFSWVSRDPRKCAASSD